MNVKITTISMRVCIRSNSFLFLTSKLLNYLIPYVSIIYFHAKAKQEVCASVLGAVSIRKTVLLGMAIPMLKIRRPTGRLIFNMGIPIPGKTVFYIETGPCSLLGCGGLILKIYILSYMCRDHKVTHDNYQVRTKTNISIKYRETSNIFFVIWCA